MSPQALVEQLMALPNAAAQRGFLEEHCDLLDDGVAEALKEHADQLLRREIHRSLEAAALLVWMGELKKSPLCRALGLLAEANARSIGGLGEYQRAVELYDEAAEIYRQCGEPLQQARAQVGKVFSLAFLGHYAEALETGRWAGEVLERHGQWRQLATLTMNMAIVPGRKGEDAEALKLFERAHELYDRLGTDGEQFLPWIDNNRATVLRNLGQFDASIEASQEAIERLARLGQRAEAARAQQNLAFTLFLLGRYNESLSLLHAAREVFLSDGRHSDAILVDLDISNCLLQLRRFDDVLEQSRQFQTQFATLGTHREAAQAVLIEAAACSGLGRYDEALRLLDEARRLFEQGGYLIWVARTNLEAATILLQQKRPAEAIEIALHSAKVFQGHGLPVPQAQAFLLAARGAMALGRHEEAAGLLHQVLAVGQDKAMPWLVYQSRHLLGLLAESAGKLDETLTEFDLAIQELERLRGRLMVEFRSDFLQDKQVLYEDMVRLCVELDRPESGLQYAERAKSRALIDMLAYRLDLNVQALGSEDTPLVEELTRLRAQRDALYRRWEGREQFNLETWAANGERQDVSQDVLALEKRITDLWHRLLIRNASYARDASLWQVRTEPIQPFLPANTALVEYFAFAGEFMAFVVTHERVQAIRLGTRIARAQQALRLLQLNFRATPRALHAQQQSLLANAQGILSQLYSLLLAPLEQHLAEYSRLILVPHGLLHYLPFSALYDGQRYLVERYELSFLPGASLLRYCRQPRPYGQGLLAVAHSYNGLLPHTVEEVRVIAAKFGGDVLLENEATTQTLRKQVSARQMLHIAAHGDFRPDNPLFSGLALADSWMTTLDIFSLRLTASLVTLSACQTGRSVVGGGDELLGLMRAFIYAGAASLVLSLWAVEDRSTAQLMSIFYDKLVCSDTKGAALRAAQLQFLHGRLEDTPSGAIHRHPYYWAPFFLVGDSGPL